MTYTRRHGGTEILFDRFTNIFSLCLCVSVFYFPIMTHPFLSGVQCLLNIRNDVFGIFNAHGEPDKVRTNAGFNQLLV